MYKRRPVKRDRAGARLRHVSAASLLAGFGTLMVVSLAAAAEIDERLLAAMVNYSKAIQARALAHGRPLDERERRFAEALGIEHADKVRVLVLPRVPEPQDPYLREKLDAIGYLPLIARAGGTAKGYGIVVTTQTDGNRYVVAHELVHVKQYERHGGIEALLRVHLPELVANGYRESELEAEAYRRANELVDCGE